MYTVDYECITYNIMMSSQTTNYHRFDTAGGHILYFPYYLHVYGRVSVDSGFIFVVVFVILF